MHEDRGREKFLNLIPSTLKLVIRCMSLDASDKKKKTFPLVVLKISYFIHEIFFKEVISNTFNSLPLTSCLCGRQQGSP